MEESYGSPATQMKNSETESEDQETARIGSKFEFCERKGEFPQTALVALSTHRLTQIS